MLVVTVETENSAFEDDGLRSEAIRILRDIAQKIEDGENFEHYQTILDINGNDVGRAKLNREIAK